MQKNFWKNLKKPVICLAPMADITDAVFRQIVAKYGKPDVMWTEFVSCDGLCSKGRDSILIDLEYSEIERPIVAQIFGSNLENCTKTARLIKRLGFDGIDINMGCPDRSVEKQGAGAALLKNLELAKEIILAAKKGAGGLPVSVKTRLGYNKIDTENIVKHLLEAKPAAITLHLRTRKEMSKVEPHWEEVSKAVELAKNTDTLIIANGDIKNLQEAKQIAEKHKIDGVMIGRAAIGNPWFFNPQKCSLTLKEKIKAMLEHAELFDIHYRDKKNFLIMRKHMNAYIKGFDNIKPMRFALMKAGNYHDAKKVVKTFIKL